MTPPELSAAPLPAPAANRTAAEQAAGRSGANPPSNLDPEPRAVRWRQGFLAYARWLDSISWKRFALLAVLGLICTGILTELPPFNIPWGSDRTEVRGGSHQIGNGSHRNAPVHIEGIAGSDGRRYEIRVDGNGVSVRPMPSREAPASSNPSSPGVPAAPTPPANPDTAPGVAPGAVPAVPPGAAPGVASGAAKITTDPSAKEIAEALSEAREALAEAGIVRFDDAETVNVRAFRLGDVLPQAMLLAIFLSLGIKIMAKGRFRAEAQAEHATEMAESESLKRHVIEARMAAMQAQVEPHFLFNTLASIDHLIETDPPRASTMQKHLIALLRASMPSLREGNHSGVRDLGRELDVIRPYLEILKVRMEDRLQSSIDVPDGLRSAEFPPMMIQSLVENAIKHGLEPKPEGGRLDVSAQVIHGQLVVRVADTGVGFGRANTAGTGTGLANLRERLSLLYGTRASLQVLDNPPSGTIVTVTLPYRSLTAGTRGN